MSTHLSTLTLHHLRYGDLDSDSLLAAREHLQTCARCAARLDVQRRERDAFVAQPMPDALRRPSRRQWPAWPLAMRWAGLALAMAAAALIWVRLPTESTGGPVADRILTKGVLPEVEVWAAAPGEPAHLLGDQERLGSGDRVSFKYDARGAAHVAFAGRDHTGVVEFYGSMPTEDGLSDAPFGLVLDDAPGVQEFFVVVADRPLDSATVIEAVSGNATDVRVLRKRVHKDTPTP